MFTIPVVFTTVVNSKYFWIYFAFIRRTSFSIPCCFVQSFSYVRLFCEPMDCSPPGFSLHGISQARMLEWLPFPSPGESSRPRNHTCMSCWGGGFFTTEPPGKP